MNDMRLGDLDKAEAVLRNIADHLKESGREDLWPATYAAADVIKQQRTIDAVPVTAAELKHLINDTIAYIWSLEDRGCDKAEYGYDSRKALLEKLKQFEKDHFPELDCGCGG